MGRLGGGELGYGSDADVMFVHDPVAGADEREARRPRTPSCRSCAGCCALPVPTRPSTLDAGCGPRAGNGPLVRVAGVVRAYYARWSLPWEAQALLRARAGGRGRASWRADSRR